jgi:hypothetical protein
MFANRATRADECARCRTLVMPEKVREVEMSRRKGLRSQLYRAARDLGNVEAAERGPISYGKRVERRRVLRTTNGVVQRSLRKLRLWG